MIWRRVISIPLIQKDLQKNFKIAYRLLCCARCPSCENNQKKNKRNVYVRLPDDVKTARSHCKIAFESWWENDNPDGNEIIENYRSKRREYRFKLRNFLNRLEAEKITKLCNAAYTNEKLFWRLLKDRQRSTLQMTAFLIDRKIITDEKHILDMWADHFEALGTYSFRQCTI